MASLSDWSPYDSYVQGGMVDGRYMNAAYTMIAAGPPRLANVGGPSFLAAARVLTKSRSPWAWSRTLASART